MFFKKIIPVLIFLILVVSVNAQKRYNHVPRTKVTKQVIVNVPIEKNISPQTNPVNYFNESNIVIQPELFNNERNVEVDNTLSNNEPVKINNKKSRILKIENKDVRNIEIKPFVLKKHIQHKLYKVSDVKDTNKTLLRTWKWLMIVMAIVILMAIVLIILNFALWPYSGLDIIGYCLGGLGVIAMFVILFLGLAGRI